LTRPRRGNPASRKHSGRLIVVFFLLDSNVAFKSDPLTSAVEDDYDLAMRFHRLVSDAGHQTLVHPSTAHDVARDPDTKRREVRERSLRRYSMLQNPPARSAEQVAVLGATVPHSNDDVDQDLLAAVVGDSVAFLVTQDEGMHRKAARLAVLTTHVGDGTRPPRSVT
jgi:hypothetical protein